MADDSLAAHCVLALGRRLRRRSFPLLLSVDVRYCVMEARLSP